MLIYLSGVVCASTERTLRLQYSSIGMSHICFNEPAYKKSYRSFETSVSQQCHNSKFVIFQEKLLKVRSAVIFYECNDDMTALKRRILQTAL